MTLFTVNPRGCGSFTTSTGGTRARSRGCPMRSSSCRGSGRGRGRGRGRAASCGSARPSSCAGACRAPAPGPTWTSTTTRRCVRAAPCRGRRGTGAGGVVFLQTGTLTSYSVINVLSIATGQTGHVWIFTSDIPGPLHEEVLSESPSIVMFHDFLTSEEIKFMKNTIMSQMKVISK